MTKPVLGTPQKYCYQCDKPVKYLFSDGRCGNCTREGSEQ